MLFKFASLFFLLGLISVKAQIGLNWFVVVDDPLQMNLVSEFICVYQNPGTNVADVLFGGGRWANNNGNPPKVFSFYDGTQSGIVSTSMFMRKAYTTPSTNWVYLSSNGTTTNLDFVQIEVVSSSYTGDCSLLQASSPPDGWVSGFPPAPVANGL